MEPLSAGRIIPGLLAVHPEGYIGVGPALVRRGPRIALAPAGAAFLLALLLWPRPAGARLLPNPLPRCPERHRGSADLDQDGEPDCWSTCQHGGSGAGGVSLKLRMPCSAPELDMDDFGSFGHFLAVAPLPADATPQQRRAVVALLYGVEALRSSPDSPPGGLEPVVDSSFRWLLDGYGWPPLPAAAPFTERRAFTPRTQAGPPAAPPPQVVVLDRPFRARLLRALGPSTSDAPRLPALVVYHAHNHGELKPVGGCKALRLYQSRHGVAFEHLPTGRSGWAFVSTGVQKLRWPSLARTACAEGLVAVERAFGSERELWIVEPLQGRLGRLPLAAGEDWSVGAEGVRVGERQHPLAALRAALLPPADWGERYDLDGDGKPDPIESRYSGGAHCCYALSIVSSLTGRRHELPFELDGGFERGLDLSQPDRFRITDLDGDGLPDLYLEVGTYNGRPQPLPKSWTSRYGFSTHRVSVGLAGGVLRVRDRL